MTTALFAFEQPAAARRAAAELRQRGLPAAAVKLHCHDDSPRDHTIAAIDEQTTGGLVTNVLGLFGEVMEWGSFPIDTSPYAAIVRRGGAVLSVDAASDVDEASANAVMTDAEPVARSEWFAFPRESQTRREEE